MKRCDLCSYICHECALAHKGTFPEGHIASLHEAMCDYCNEIKSVCDETDWQWPKDKS